MLLSKMLRNKIKIKLQSVHKIKWYEQQHIKKTITFSSKLKEICACEIFLKKMVGRCAAFRFQGLVRFDKKKIHIKKYDRLHLNSLEMLQTSFSFTIFLL